MNRLRTQCKNRKNTPDHPVRSYSYFTESFYILGGERGEGQSSKAKKEQAFPPKTANIAKPQTPDFATLEKTPKKNYQKISGPNPAKPNLQSRSGRWYRYGRVGVPMAARGGGGSMGCGRFRGYPPARNPSYWPPYRQQPLLARHHRLNAARHRHHGIGGRPSDDQIEVRW